LAETYYALPDVVGGDLDLAIKMLRSASERAPDNPRYAQLLASYLLDQGQAEEASAILKEMLSMQTDMAGWQLLADQLRVAADMAKRIGDVGLAEQLDQRRAGMFEQHAFLQTRSVVSAMGHFGTNNPMTVP
jgi:predicted Zn-dependent protease